MNILLKVGLELSDYCHVVGCWSGSFILNGL
jgi:hypothetical protein